jgi:ribosomal 50S subunit-associated protein YjgA (DUF615 family)
MLRTTNQILISTEDEGTIRKSNVAVETPRVMDKRKGELRNEVLNAYSVSDQLNALRKAVLKALPQDSDEYKAIKAMDDTITSIVSSK